MNVGVILLVAKKTRRTCIGDNAVSLLPKQVGYGPQFHLKKMKNKNKFC